jgi:hypothetical protein
MSGAWTSTWVEITGPGRTALASGMHALELLVARFEQATGDGG